MAKVIPPGGRVAKFAPRKVSREASGKTPGAFGKLLKALPIRKIFSRSAPATRYPLESRWHAVSIMPSEPCAAADAIGPRRRYLPSEAPRLPLPECPRAHACTCAYRHFTDRRSLARRGSSAGLVRQQQPIERRLKRGRRAAD